MKWILVPTDFSKYAENAMQYAVDLAKHTHAKIMLHSVVNTSSGSAGAVGGLARRLKEDTEAQLEKIKQKWDERRASGEKVPEIEMAVTEGSVVDEIVAVAKELPVNYIVMGTLGSSGLEEVILGSVAAKVIEYAHCPVLAVPEHARFSGFSKIAFGMEGKSEAEERVALSKLVAFAEYFDSVIELVHIQSTSEPLDKAATEAMRKELAERISYNKVDMTIYHHEDVIEGLNVFIEDNNISLLALLTHKRGFFKRFFDKSLTKKMAMHTTIPLLAFHAG